MTPRYRGATSIPAKMWKKLIEIARTYPAPHQFYEKAVALGKEYDIDEKELIAWGTIDPYHKPKQHREPPATRRQAEANIRNYTEPREQAAPLITEEAIERGHREKEKP